jgi:hypothetical protein
MADIKNWSGVDDDNSEASPNGFPEGMARSGVNDSARAMMGAIRDFYAAAEWVTVYVTTGDAWTATKNGDAQMIIEPADGQNTNLSSTGENRFPDSSRVRLSANGTPPYQYGFVSSTSYADPDSFVNVTIDDGAVITAGTNTVEIGVVRDLLTKTAYYPTGATTGQTPPEVPTIDDLGDGATNDMGHGNNFNADTVDGYHASDLISSAAGAGKNIIYNGGIDVWQRGLNINSTTTNGRIYINDNNNYCADRWRLLSGNGVTPANDKIVVSRDTTSPPTGYYAALEMTTQSYVLHDKFGIFQVLEARDSAAIIGSSSVSMGVELKGEGTLANARFIILGWDGAADAAALGDDPITNWQSVGVLPTFDPNWNVLADSGATAVTPAWGDRKVMEDEDISGFPNIVNIGILIYSDSVFSVGNSLSVAGVRVENGSVASSFQPSDYSTELNRCQRYFLTTFEEAEDARTQAGIDQAIGGMTTANSTEQCLIKWVFPVTMFKDPTVNVFNPTNNVADTIWGARTTSDIDYTALDETISNKAIHIGGSNLTDPNSQNTLVWAGLTLDAEF